MEWLLLTRMMECRGVRWWYQVVFCISKKADHLLALLLPSSPCTAFPVDHGHSSVVSRTGDTIIILSLALVSGMQCRGTGRSWTSTSLASEQLWSAIELLSPSAHIFSWRNSLCNSLHNCPPCGFTPQENLGVSARTVHCKFTRPYTQ